MTITSTVALGLLIMLGAFTLVLCLSAALVMLASRFVVGRAGMFGSAAMAVFVAMLLNAGVYVGAVVLAVRSPELMPLVIAGRIVLGIALTILAYRLLLDPRPTLVQALLIFVLQTIAGAILMTICYFLAVYVVRVPLPPLPAVP